MADFGGTDLDTFRAETRDWLEKHFPASLQGKQALMATEGPGPSGGDFQAWKTAMGEAGLGRPHLAHSLWRRRAHRRPGQGAARGDGQGRRPQPHRRHGRDHVRPDPAGVRHRSAEAAAHPADREGELRWCQGFSEPGRGLRPRLAADQGRGQGRPLSWSTARRSGPAAPSTPTGASAWCAPTPPRSTRASASC